MAEKTRREPKKKSRSIKRPKRRKKAKKKTPPRESTPTGLNRQTSCDDGSFGELDADMIDDDEEDAEEDEDDLEDEEEDDDDEEEESGAAAGGSGSGEARAEPELDRSLELHLGTVLENEFSEVLSKLPDEAFTELFSDAHASDLVHKETEELERALEAVERESDAQGSSGATPKVEFPVATAAGGSEPVATAARHHVLNGNPNLGSAEMEESVYNQLAQGISLEHAISNVLNGQEMNTLNQLLNHLGETVIQDADNATISAS
ncbi:46 kDa FK506-binding nuclear protein-like [Pollicipes pollicipes]|uniref:46 kDa FK506-binding nuclear protein-like n=1 Tax=Pollicipes pollicipes TaxID=41117 RepID=UPI0018858B82|nr:46 kDa FK506-binding nuclear protein-like [Pollicipes pollicipes]